MALRIPPHWQKLENGFYFDMEAGVMFAPPSRLEPDPDQPRGHFDREKMARVKKNIEFWRARGRGLGGTGFLSPLLGRWEPGAYDDSGKLRRNAKIILIDGERRWRISHDKDDKPVFEWLPVTLDTMSAKEARDAAFATSLHNESLLPIEEAHAFMDKMNEMGWKIGPCAAHYSVAPSYVQNRIDLLEMDEDVQELVGTRPDTLTSAKVIQKVKSKGVRATLLQDAAAGASFREISDRAAPFIGGTDRKARKAPQVPRIDAGKYCDNAIHNLIEVRDALAAVSMPKSYYKSISPRLKKIIELAQAIQDQQ